MPNYQHVCRVEVVGLASVGCVGNVILGQFLYGSENRVGTACAKCRMKREVIHQMSGDILYAWAATEINAHKRTDDFAVLITIQPASHTEGWVDYRWEIGVKLLHYWKKLLHYWKKILQKERVSQILLLFLSCLSGLIHILICNSKICEKSDMAKSWATFGCSGT